MDANVRGILSENEYKGTKRKIAYLLIFVFALLLTLVMFYPFFWVFTSSLKGPDEIYSVPQSLLPAHWLWENFGTAWDFYEFPRVIFNTLLLFIGFFVSKLIVLSLAAYALSRMRLPFRWGFYMLFLATLMMPPIAYLVPSYLVIQNVPLFNVNLIDTFWSIWLPAGADSFSLLLLKGFFDNIPRELSEASKMDGASDVRILASVILPLSKPIIAVIAIFAFLGIWNDFFWQRLMLVSPDRWTVSVMLWFRSTVVGATPPINVQLAAMFLSIIPPMILFLVFQKHITTGVTLTGIKG